MSHKPGGQLFQIRPFVAPGFGENGYIVWRDGATTAVAIDPGNSVAPMLSLLGEEGLRSVPLDTVNRIQFLDETLDAAFDRLRLNPSVGMSVRSGRRTALRVLWLERIGYMLYYRVEEDTIEILALWHASRGSRPRF